MYRLLLCTLTLAVMLNGCKKDEGDEETEYPVWILNVNVRDGAFPSRPLPACAHVIWKYEGEFQSRDVACRGSYNFVKVWESIRDDVRVFYHVECPGYQPSGEEYADFSYALVDTVEGRDGPEVIQTVTVTIYPE